MYNTSYVYEFTGCVLTFYGLTMENWNDKDYKSMLNIVLVSDVMSFYTIFS